MSSALTEADAPPTAPRAGADLRAARERLGWSLEEVAAGLRIRQPHLEALEEGRIELLPGYAYAVGFLRTYAKALGLDPDEIARRFKAEASDVNRRTELIFPAPMPQRGLPAGAVILLGVVLAVGAYAGWYRLSGEGKLPAETVTPVPARLASLADQAVPSTAKPVSPHAQATAATPATAPSPTVAATAASPQPIGTVVGTAEPVAQPTTAAAAAPPPVAVQAAQIPAPPIPSISPTSAAAAPVSPQALAALPATASSAQSPSQIDLEATADAWMEVRDPSGKILLNRVLHNGDSWAVPAQPGLVLTTGNAGGTEIVVDGVAMPVPGGSGAVRRDLPLDAALIKGGGLAEATPMVAHGGTGSGDPRASAMAPPTQDSQQSTPTQ